MIQVTFSSSVAVVLIASCSELSESLKSVLWYGDEDYLNFRDEVRRRNHMKFYFRNLSFF